MIREMLVSRHGSVKVLEALELSMSLRDYARWVVPESETMRYERLVSVMGLQFLKSDYLLTGIQSNANNREFVHEYMRKTNSNKEDSYRIMYLSLKDPKALLIAEGDHRAMGRLLGYPECCINSFIKHHEHNHKTILYPWSIGMHQKLFLKSTLTHHPYYYNILRRHKGFSFFSHIPCSASCPGSHRIGRMRSMVMEDYDFELYDYIRRGLTGKEYIMGKRLSFY
ncbi:MAG: DUF483 domain-containing protein [Candidatus Woesearchaeota archaeon]